MSPVFVAKKVTDYGWSKIVKDLHIRFSLQQDDVVFTGIGFNLAEKFSLLQPGKPIDVVFNLDENEWNNEKHLQLKVIDFRLSEN
jgi:single-stranded-DNA-specific exonuclease